MEALGSDTYRRIWLTAGTLSHYMICQSASKPRNRKVQRLSRKGVGLQANGNSKRQTSFK